MSQLKNSRGVSTARVALLYQAIEPPTINGVRKPMKPGGRCDRSFTNVQVLILFRLPRRMRRRRLQPERPAGHRNRHAHRFTRPSRACGMELSRLRRWHTCSSAEGSHTPVRQHGRLCQPSTSNIPKSRRTSGQSQGRWPSSMHG
jgi:hypothetical protein